MGIDDLVENHKKQAGIEPADAEDLELNEFDWKYVMAHYPWVAQRLATSDKNGENEAKLVADMMEELIEEGHDSFNVTSNMREKLQEGLDHIKEEKL